MEWTPPHIMSDPQKTHTHAAPADPARQDLGAPISMFLFHLESHDTHHQDFVVAAQWSCAVMPACRSTKPSSEVAGVLASLLRFLYGPHV